MYVFAIIGLITVIVFIVIIVESYRSTPSSPSSPPPRSTYASPAPARPQASSKGFTMSQINQMSQVERRVIAEVIGCDVSNLSSIDNLAISTILLEKTIKLSATDSYLCKSPVCSCDTTIFTLFVVRVLSIYSCPTEEKAHWFSDYYVPLVIRGIEFRYADSIPQLDEMLSNRIEFYDRVFASKADFPDRLEALLEEFEYIIKTDIIKKEYTPFSESSPLPILGAPDDNACRIQAANFFKNILRFLAPYYKEAMDDMNV